jgi:hypothetical protein
MQSTMGVQSRPDASNRMTKHNGPPSHLLSTFRKQDEVKVEPAPDVAQPSIEVGAQQDIDIDADMVSSSPLTDVPSDVEDPDLEPEIVHTAQVASRLEPATEDEPMSTEDEEECSDIDSSPPRKETNYTTMEQRFAENKSSWGNSSPSKSGSRPRSTLVDSDDENMAFWSSQQSKRSKPNTYQTAQKSYFNKKTFGKPTPKPSPKARAKKIPRSEKKADEPSQEPESSFKVPKDIDSPTFKPKTKNGDSFSFGTFSSKENDAMQYSSDADSPLSSASSTMLKGMEEALEGREPSPPRKAVCPMCQTEVEPEILALFHSQPKQRIREQQQFCESHKLRSAAKEWEEAGYPVILWENFEARVQGLFPDIEKLLNPDASSYYRNILDTALKSGRAFNSKSILEGDGLEKITCGYYGSKGASKMYVAWIYLVEYGGILTVF